jgi:hypothetical protein
MKKQAGIRPGKKAYDRKAPLEDKYKKPDYAQLSNVCTKPIAVKYSV